MSDLTVRFSVRFGRQRETEPPAPSRPEKKEPEPTTPTATRLARQLALAHHVERLVELGAIKKHAAAARALGVSRARIAQVMCLLQLSPELQAVVLAGRVTSEQAVRHGGVVPPVKL